MGNLFSSNPNKYRYINVYDDLTLKSILHNMNEPMLLFNTSICPYKNKIKENYSPYEVSLPLETISIHSLFPTVLPDLSTTSDDKSNDKNENKINIPITKINNEEEQKDNNLKKEISDIADKIYNSDKEKSLEDSLSLNKMQSIHDTSTEEEKELSQTNKSNLSSQKLYPAGDDLINSISKTVEQQGGKCKKRYRKRYQKGGSYNVCGKINKQKYDEKPVDLSKY